MSIKWSRKRTWNPTFVYQLTGFVDSQKAFHIARYGKHWYAFFLPEGWNDFGNSVIKDFKGNSQKQTLREAIASCEEHLKTFGVNPGSYKSLQGK
jgi:hypothetical protein